MSGEICMTTYLNLPSLQVIFVALSVACRSNLLKAEFLWLISDLSVGW